MLFWDYNGNNVLALKRGYLLMGEMAKEANAHMLLITVTASQRKPTRG